MLYGEIIAVCSQIHTKYINKFCGQNIELLNVKTGGAYSDTGLYWEDLEEVSHSPLQITVPLYA